MSSQQLSANVRDGFMPHFTSGYLDRYGPTSEFVRAVADHLTLNLASIIERSGRFVDPGDVARLSDDEAVAVLRALMKNVDSLKREIFREALGSAPLNTGAVVVDAALGQGSFANWLKAFQARDFELCSQISRSGGANVVA
jgi:hypothetical protein